jgi:hypothetical protein
VNNEELFRLIERGPDDVGAALKLLEQAIAEERTEAKRLVRELWTLMEDVWERIPEPGYSECRKRVGEFLRRG